MKRILLIIPVIFLAGLSVPYISNAQNFAYVDSEYILENVPEYQEAKKQLRQTSEQWREEIRRKRSEINDLRGEYEAEKVLLPENVREQRRQEIQQKEKELEKYREEKFGRNGELYQKRDQLLEPIQDRVFDAVQQMARDSGLDFVFDRAGAVTMLYYSARFDRSDEVLKEMGIDPPDDREEEEERSPEDRDRTAPEERELEDPGDMDFPGDDDFDRPGDGFDR